MSLKQKVEEKSGKYTWEDIDNSVEFEIDLDKEINVFYGCEYK